MIRSLLLGLALLVIFVPRSQADEILEAPVKAAELSTETAELLRFIQQRSREVATAEELSPLLRDLASKDEAIAKRASSAIVAAGPLAVPSLRRAINELADPLLAERARKCLSRIEGSAGSELVAAVVALIGARRPPEAMETLLKFLPYANDSLVLDASGRVLAELAYRDGKADPALMNALESPVPLLRAMAAESLARVDHPETRPSIARLLSDTSVPVRTRSAVALAKVEDVAAVPVLIDLMGQLAKADRSPVEDVLRNFAGETIPKDLPTGDEEKDRQTLKQRWTDWWNQVDGIALIKEFRTRSLEPSEREGVLERIRLLGDNNYRAREKASQELVGMGAKVLAELRQATQDADGERSRRAEDCIAKIQALENKRVPGGAARLLALRRPSGAVEAMLAYLPYADEDDGMIAEVKTALTSLALDANGTPTPALVKGLADPAPIRRSASAEALLKGGARTVRPEIKKLLADRDLDVRQAVAALLTASGERDAVPVLIDLLAELPLNRSWQAQDVLHQLAGEKSPPVSAGDQQEERKKYRDTWAAWWNENAPKVDLARLSVSAAEMGFTLLVQVGNNNIGRVAEIGRDGKVRWEIKNLNYPVDAFVLPGERVLITEWNGNRVAEWDFRGNILWKMEEFNGRVTNAQRLPNGNTFICTTNEILEVERGGKIPLRLKINQGLTAAYRLPNGEIACLRNDGKVVRYDSSGKELTSFASNRDTSWTSGIDVTRTGNILVSQPSPAQKVTEYSPDGKVVKEWATPQVTTATRLTNGHILMASHNDKRVTELDANGRKVWEYKDEYHIFRARRR